MNCLYITLFFKIVAGIFQTFIKPWNPFCVSPSHRSLPPVTDQRWPTAPLFVVKISPSFREFTAPLRHILPIHNVTINSNNLFVNFRWTFTFCVEKSYDGTHLVLVGLWIGAATSNTSHSNKAVSITVKRARLTGKGSRWTAMFATINIKISLSAYT
jgi:hypothetical protein